MISSPINTQNREIKVETWQKDTMIRIIAILIIVGFFMTIIAVWVIDIKPGNIKLAYMLFGALISGFNTIINYIFGSSLGSKMKDFILSNKKD